MDDQNSKIGELRSQIETIDRTLNVLIESRLELSRQIQNNKTCSFSSKRESDIKELYKHREIVEAILTTAKKSAMTPKTRSDWWPVVGPCSVDEHTYETARELRILGATHLRGGCWKPRTSPHDWQGPGLDGLIQMREVCNTFGLSLWTEVLSPDHIAHKKMIDVPWIGARNGQNFDLISRVASNWPVMALKRGPWMTVMEWLNAAEYATKENCQVILIERGITGHDPMFRNTLDLAGALLAKALSNHKVLVDVSHSTGMSGLVSCLVDVVRASGLDGVMIESHIKPTESKTDAFQAVLPSEIKNAFI